MSEERRKVLEMLAEGKITAEETERLLDKLAAGEKGAGPSRAADPSAAQGRPRPKFLRIVVDGCPEKANIKIPLVLVRAGLKLSTMLPEGACAKLSAQGIDLSGLAGLTGEEIIDALKEFSVDVDSPGGECVRVFCE